MEEFSEGLLECQVQRLVVQKAFASNGSLHVCANGQTLQSWVTGRELLEARNQPTGVIVGGRDVESPKGRCSENLKVELRTRRAALEDAQAWEQGGWAKLGSLGNEEGCGKLHDRALERAVEDKLFDVCAVTQEGGHVH